MLMQSYPSQSISPQVPFGKLVVGFILLLLAYFLAMSHFSSQGFQKIKISAETIFGKPLPGNSEVLHSFGTEDIQFGELAFHDMQVTLRVARTDRTSESEVTSGEFLALVNQYRLTGKSDSNVNPQLLRYTSAQIDARKARNKTSNTFLLFGKTPITLETFFTKPERGHALTLISNAEARYVFIFSGKKQVLEVESLRKALESIPLIEELATQIA